MEKKKKLSLNILLNILLIVAGLLYLFPFYITLVNSMKDRAQMNASVLGLPNSFDLQYYIKAMEKMNFLGGFLNSLLIAVASIGCIVILSSMTAWMLVRTKSKLSTVMFYSFVATMIIPFQAVMMPLMQFMGLLNNNLGLPMLNHRFGLIYMYIGFGAGMAVFLYHGFIRGSIPASLEEAATIDGCSKWRTFWKIVFPMLKPTTVTVIILDIIWIWNDFLLPSLALSSKDLRTIPLSTFYFFGQFTIEWNMAMSGLILTIIPVVIFYMFAQKYIIKGVAEGALK